MIWALYAVLGAAAGFLGGLLGLGGGIIVVPALFFIFKSLPFASEAVMHLAVGSSLATAILTAATSTWAHHRHGAVLWHAVTRLGPGILLGGLLGGLIADWLAGAALRVIFGVFELLVAAQLLFGLKPHATRSLPSAPAMVATGAGIGTLSAILGIGGGTMTVPFLAWCNVGMRQAVATSAAVGLPITIAGTVGHVLAGWNNVALPTGSTGYVYWPAVAVTAAVSVFFAPLGARVAHSIPVNTLKRIFALAVALIGIRMLFG